MHMLDTTQTNTYIHPQDRTRMFEMVETAEFEFHSTRHGAATRSPEGISLTRSQVATWFAWLASWVTLLGHHHVPGR